MYDYTGSKVQGPQGLSVLFDLALTDRNMNAGCNFKGVLECWDSGILLSKSSCIRAAGGTYSFLDRFIILKKSDDDDGENSNSGYSLALFKEWREEEEKTVTQHDPLLLWLSKVSVIGWKLWSLDKVTGTEAP